MRFDVLKKYLRMMKPLFSFRGTKSSSSLTSEMKFNRQPHSFSGNTSSRMDDTEKGLLGRRGEFSAPASMRTSPTNSGLLVAKGPISTSTNDSSMEELHAAIQAAITHCKNSIAIEEKIKCPN